MLKFLSVPKEFPYRHLGLFVWYFFVALPILCCILNLWIELNDSFNQPETKVEYKFGNVDKVFLPVISIRPIEEHPHLLDPFKISHALNSGSLTLEHIDAITAGVGMINRNFYLQHNNIHTKAYDEAVQLYGSISKARMALHNQNGITCQDFFVTCRTYFRQLNCCDIFELIWSLRGPYYALRPESIGIANISQEILFAINATTGGNDWNKTVSDWEDIYSPGYIVEIGSSLDQTPQASGFLLESGDEAVITFRMRTRILDPYHNNCYTNPKLKYFLNYTVKNCIWERGVLEKLPLCNITCQLPILELMNTKIDITNPCPLTTVNEFNMNLWKFDDNQGRCSEVCVDDPSCVAKLQCYYPCEHMDFQVSIIKSKRNGKLANQANIWLEYETFEIQVVKHEPRFTDAPRLAIVDGIGLLGGVLGLWLDISVMSLLKYFKAAVCRIWESMEKKRNPKDDIENAQNMSEMNDSPIDGMGNDIITVETEEKEIGMD